MSSHVHHPYESRRLYSFHLAVGHGRKPLGAGGTCGGFGGLVGLASVSTRPNGVLGPLSLAYLLTASYLRYCHELRG